ncbi:glycosyltransferase family 4 protein [Massilibacterium senegalense]|uniref:glycosyltransferase family 4 protein n=1 Tax=Massilibacterium senegalense TaxID=1632858 RepID=UPI00078664BF|nr:glycosyltransferase family 4 protein [Massilibacterium senegalense]
MRKILFVATVYTHLANFHKPYMQYFSNHGYEVHALANSNEGRMNEIEELGVVCHDFDFSRSMLSLAHFKAVKDLSTFFKNTHYDLVHVHTPIASFLTRFVLRKNSSTKVVYTAHGFHFFKGAPFINWLLFYPSEKIAKKWTDSLIVMNSEDFKNAEKMGFENEKNLFFINGVGIDSKKLKENVSEGLVRKELSIPSDAIVLSCIAELNDNKNQMYVLRNWKTLYQRNKNVYLLLAGHGVNEEKYYQYVKDEKLQNVKILGYRSDIPNILMDTDAVLLLSKREGLPKSLMEALSFGKPIIGTNVRGTRDIVKDQYNGFLINLDDDTQLINSIVTIIKEPSLIRKLGENAKKEASKYELKNILLHYEKVYQNMLTQSADSNQKVR